MTDVIVRTGTGVATLAEIRRALDGADEALLCVAFVHARGLNLLAAQLPKRTRLLATTAFGTTTAEGLDLARRSGVDVRILNPAGASYHPKVYLGRHGDRTRAVVGSANLTGGLVCNIEAITAVEGRTAAGQLESLWTAAEGWWADPISQVLTELPATAVREVMPAALRARVEQLRLTTDTVFTISDGKPNRITEVVADGVYVDTDRSATPQLVPAWMLTVAWEHLSAHGELTNRFLLADDGLNVKRSSFVCALLAALPEVEVVGRRPVRLLYRPGGFALAAEEPARYDPQHRRS